MNAAAPADDPFRWVAQADDDGIAAVVNPHTRNLVTLSHPIPWDTFPVVWPRIAASLAAAWNDGWESPTVHEVAPW